jgi:DNA-binding transcriptional MerR regulator
MRVTAATARRILRRQGMPPKEIRAVLAADDPLVVRRLLELHRERLEEWLEEQERLVVCIERLYGIAASRYGVQTDVVPA